MILDNWSTKHTKGTKMKSVCCGRKSGLAVVKESLTACKVTHCLGRTASFGLKSMPSKHRVPYNTPAMPLHDAHFGGFFVSQPCHRLGALRIILANNTPHASRQICAPWGVTFFWGRKYALR